jgi:ketosteroid isomerase-like protein
MLLAFRNGPEDMTGLAVAVGMPPPVLAAGVPTHRDGLAVPRLFASLRAKDLQAVCRDLSDNAIFEFPGRSRLSGTYRGRDAIEGFFRQVFERYETFDIRPKRIALTHPYTFGATNAALVEWVLDAVTHDRLVPHFEGVVVLQLRRGKLIYGRDYFFDPSLLEPIWGRREEQRDGTTSGP